MLPLRQKLAFLLFAAIALTFAARGFRRLYRRIHSGRADPEPRFDHLAQRLDRALILSLTQSRTFRKRPVVSILHSVIFYGFSFYLLVNLTDALEAFFPIHITSPTYLFLADLLSFLVLLAVLALVARRLLLPSRRDFRFNPRTLLHPSIRQGRITRDSLIVSAFILLHVGSRALAAAARLTQQGANPAEPFATILSRSIPPAHAHAFYVLGFWGALGSVLAFLPYFPYTKHIHLFLAPFNYATARQASAGVIPPLDLTTEDPAALGAAHLEDLSWPRLLDAYACIQCNRCQDVCPASITGKSLSPAALEINKRMELNATFHAANPEPKPLLQFALSPEAAWACTTCGACMAVCPTQDEQMLDILDIRRHQVMVEANFPAPLQSAFRGMERSQNPWGINRSKRMDWAEGLHVPTTAENPTPHVLYWVGCAASYDPSAQKTARAFVQLLTNAGVDFAVLGKSECCTGDTARRAGNEYLYRQLADENVATLNTLAPKLIVASCPHCLNSIRNEYKQIGGHYNVQHHTQYLDALVASGKLNPQPTSTPTTYHDPCYLGRHNGIYDAPRNLLNILSNDVHELPRTREDAFCCGAGGAQFWKEEKPGDQRIADNRFEEIKQTLARSNGPEKVLAVACPFCKSMLASTPAKASSENIVIKDVAELLLEALPNSTKRSEAPLAAPPTLNRGEPVGSMNPPSPPAIPSPMTEELPHAPEAQAVFTPQTPGRKKWTPRPEPASALPASTAPHAQDDNTFEAAESKTVAEPHQGEPLRAPDPRNNPQTEAPASPNSALSPQTSSTQSETSTLPRTRRPWNPKNPKT